MPSNKKNKTRVTRKKDVKTTPPKAIKKAPVSKVKKVKSKSSCAPVVTSASTQPTKPRIRSSVKKTDQTRVVPARKVGRSPAKTAADVSQPEEPSNKTLGGSSNKKKSYSSSKKELVAENLFGKDSTTGMAAKKEIRQGHAAAPDCSTSFPTSMQISPTGSNEVQISETTSLHKGSSDPAANYPKKAFNERRRLDNDKREYEQGALFMDEFETYQEGELNQAAKSPAQRYSHRKTDKHTMDASANSQLNGQNTRRKNSEWRGEERSDSFQPSSQQQVPRNEHEADEGAPMKASHQSDAGQLQIKLSTSLYRKLIAKAEMEGVTVDEFAGELLAEGLVLRAWEIMERKSAMRSGHSGNNSNYGGQQNRQQNRYGFRNNANNQNSNNNNNNSSYNRNRSQHGGNNSNHGNMSSGGNNRGRMSYSNIMDDSANFLEYVRSQEKKQK